MAGNLQKLIKKIIHISALTFVFKESNTFLMDKPMKNFIKLPVRLSDYKICKNTRFHVIIKY